jgi:hypothetical protein
MQCHKGTVNRRSMIFAEDRNTVKNRSTRLIFAKVFVLAVDTVFELRSSLTKGKSLKLGFVVYRLVVMVSWFNIKNQFIKW